MADTTDDQGTTEEERPDEAKGASSEVRRPPGGAARVLVVGAGVSGLTAAHELVDRGFFVEVVEKLARPFRTRTCEPGGLARSQWSAVMSTSEVTVVEPLMAGPKPLGEALDRDDRIAFDPCRFDLSTKAFWQIDQVKDRLLAYLAAGGGSRESPPRSIAIAGYAFEGELWDAVTRTARVPVLEPELLLCDERFGLTTGDIGLYYNLVGRPMDSPLRRLSHLRAMAVWGRLRTIMGGDFGGFAVDFGGLGDAVPDLVGADSGFGQAFVEIRSYDPVLPGEHGYRFFPSFYRHVFDTMRRTPVLERAEVEPHEVALAREIGRSRASGEFRVSRATESYRTVFDNLVPTLDFKIATGDGRAPIAVPRTRAGSFAEVRSLALQMFGRLKIEAADLARFTLKLAQYATSCAARRQTYEEQTWADFVAADRCSQAFRDALERWPQALVGIRSTVADARTVGTISMQLLLDQTTSAGVRDATLNGPTSTAWFAPWQEYLAARGVRFHRATLEGLRLDGGRASCEWEGGRPDLVGEPDYLLLALSPLETHRVISSMWRAASGPERAAFRPELRAILDLFGRTDAGDGALPVDRSLSAESGPVRHYGGIQFYLPHDLGPAEGHIYLAASDYRLSAISQAQHWRQRLSKGGAGDIAGGDPLLASLLCVLSIDIGDWYSASSRSGKRAVDCSRDELAEEVWDQLCKAVSHGGWTPAPYVGYHIDDDMVYGPRRRDPPEKNASPYLVCQASDWKMRPQIEDLSRGYDVFFHNLSVAGTLMPTFTRLTTMESANESARHAVNGLLREHARKTEVPVARRCLVWNPEDEEIADLDWLKDLDADLHARGLPHFLEILEIESLIDRGLEAPSAGAILDGLRLRSGSGKSATEQLFGLPLDLIRGALRMLFG